jgi:hypothetical protein
MAWIVVMLAWMGLAISILWWFVLPPKLARG